MWYEMTGNLSMDTSALRLLAQRFGTEVSGRGFNELL